MPPAVPPAYAPTAPPTGPATAVHAVIHDVPPLAAGVKSYGVPFTEIASDLGTVVVKNVVALGALQAATDLFPRETFLTAIRQALKEKCAMIPLNEEAFNWGVRAVIGTEPLF